MEKAFSLFVVIFAWFNINLLAQDARDIKVTGSFEQVSLLSFFQQLETQCSCIFLYDEKQLDSINVSLVFQNEYFHDVVEKALKNTDLQFSIDHQNRVYITKGIKVITKLPVGFFSTQDKNDEIVSDSLVDYGLDLKKARSVTY